MNKVVWSHSSLKDYEGCAHRYYEVKVLKNYKFKDTDATLYGKELHTAAEEYIRDGKALPPQFEFVKDMLDALNRKPGRKLCEHQMALTIDLNPCDWKSEDVWVRGIADLLMVDEENRTARVVD